MAHRVEQIGPCELHLCDCAGVLPTLTGVDAVVTDPPYGIALSNHARGKERRDRDWTIAGDTTQDAGNRVLDWANDLRICTVAFASPSKPWPGEWRSRLVWHKHGLGMGGDRNLCWKTDWELIQVRHNRRLSGTRESAVIIGHNIRPAEFEFHPCQKPVSLLAYLIEKVQAEIVFDPFMGSGTTGVACIETDRKFIGCEVNEAYFDIACNRIRRAWQEKRSELKFEEPTHATH